MPDNNITRDEKKEWRILCYKSLYYLRSGKILFEGRLRLV